MFPYEIGVQEAPSENNCIPEYDKIRGVIRRYSGLPKLRKPIFAIIFPFVDLSKCT